ncbi:MAG: hypothetical protein H0W05_00255 [Thermoleophilaceae bacterium]|jgi:hypothetical protein|nr:hypothetical protein [Thermoleophilaceae bacterium]
MADSTTDDKARRVDVGFSGGQILVLRMTSAPYDALKAALAGDRAERWHTVAAEDSDVTLDLSQLVYVRLDTELHRVGF